MRAAHSREGGSGWKASEFRLSTERKRVWLWFVARLFTWEWSGQQQQRVTSRRGERARGGTAGYRQHRPCECREGGARRTDGHSARGRFSSAETALLCSALLLHQSSVSGGGRGGAGAGPRPRHTEAEADAERRGRGCCALRAHTPPSPLPAPRTTALHLHLLCTSLTRLSHEQDTRHPHRCTASSSLIPRSRPLLSLRTPRHRHTQPLTSPAPPHPCFELCTARPRSHSSTSAAQPSTALHHSLLLLHHRSLVPASLAFSSRRLS